jgi:hypothetical protein
MPLKVAPKKQATEDPRHTQAVQNYETGLRALQEHKFEKAKGHLQKVLSGPNKALVDRAQVHILAPATSIWKRLPCSSKRLRSITTMPFRSSTSGIT